MNSFNSLPDHFWHELMKYLPLKTKKNMRVVCKLWEKRVCIFGFLSVMLLPNNSNEIANWIYNKLVFARVHGASIKSEGLCELSDFLVSQTPFVSLDETMEDSILSALHRNISFYSLNLCGNSIDTNALISFSRVLNQNSSIQILDLSKNCFHTPGLKALGLALANNYTLHTLILRNNQISGEGASELGFGLMTNSTLRVLDLAYNNIDNQGIVSIAQASQLNPSIQYLDLRSNIIDNQGSKSVIKLIQFGHLVYLDVRDNHIDKEGIKGLSTALTTSKTIKTAYLRDSTNFALRKMKFKWDIKTPQHFQSKGTV